MIYITALIMQQLKYNTHAQSSQMVWLRHLLAWKIIKYCRFYCIFRTSARTGSNINQKDTFLISVHANGTSKAIGVKVIIRKYVICFGHVAKLTRKLLHQYHRAHYSYRSCSLSAISLAIIQVSG